MRLMTLVLLMAGMPALADVAAVTRVFGQIVRYDLPQGFVPAHEGGDGGFYIQEAVLQGETVQDWSQMITLTGQEGQTGQGAEGLARFIAGNYLNACPDSFTATELTDVAVPGAVAVFSAYVSCGRVAATGQSEAMVFLAIIGTDDAYSLQWAERGPAQDSALPLDPARWMERWQALADSVMLCPPVAGEGPPYPSCR
jgi:hypothetical protein